MFYETKTPSYAFSYWYNIWHERINSVYSYLNSFDYPLHNLFVQDAYRKTVCGPNLHNVGKLICKLCMIDDKSLVLSY